MRKLFTRLVLFVMLAAVAFYFYIPTTKNIHFQTLVNCTEGGATRQIIHKGKWQLWWPGQKKEEGIYTYNNYNYRIDKILLNGFETTIFNGPDSIKGKFQFEFFGIDTTFFVWNMNSSFSSNPVTRVNQYFQFNKFKSNVESLLGDIKKYFEKQENVYGMKVVQQTVTEASYISTKKTFTTYPTTQEIYDMIKSLQDYTNKKGSEVKGYPMLHVEQEGAAIFITMVALPTKNELPTEGEFQLKKMILGNILMGEVKGGNYTITTGEKELANYVIDYKKLSPAVGFQSLITNRLLEADTTKWVTRLYYPIFQ
jgi:hypothetical protein